MTVLRHAALAVVVSLAVACGGKVNNSDLEVNDSAGSGLAASSPTTPNDSASDDTTGDDGADTGGEVGDKDCEDGDHHGHGRHHRHKFSVLDALDGAKDGKITIASLPAGTPDRLLEKLAKLDADHDGIVTRAEVKAFRKGHKKHHHHHDDDGAGEGADVAQHED